MVQCIKITFQPIVPVPLFFLFSCFSMPLNGWQIVSNHPMELVGFFSKSLEA